MNAIVLHEDEKKEENEGGVDMIESCEEEIVATIIEYILTQYRELRNSENG